MIGSETVSKILDEITEYRLKQYVSNAAPMYRAGELTLSQISKIFGLDEKKCLVLLIESENNRNQP